MGIQPGLSRIEDFEGPLRRLASRMLREFPRVRRWEDTDDILQESCLRLWQALATVEIQSELHLHRLAALQIRHVLLDLIRRFRSGGHFAANHESVAGRVEHHQRLRTGTSDTESLLDDWSDFHLAVQQLQSEDREMFDLLWYSGQTPERAAQLLGVSVRQVQRRWLQARIQLGRSIRRNKT